METHFPFWYELTEETTEVSSVYPEEVEETISQFEACVQEILYQPYLETIHE